MMNIKFVETSRTNDEDANAVYTWYDIIIDGKKVGDIEVVTDFDKNEADSVAYIERIDIDEAFRNQGIGTATIEKISEEHEYAVLAPDNEDAQRLYERLGYDISDHEVYGYCDQGYGVYRI